MSVPAVEATLLVTVPTVLPRALPRPPVTSVTLATPDVSVVVVREVPDVVEVPDLVALVSTDPVAALLVVPPTPAGQAAAPSETPEFVE